MDANFQSLASSGPEHIDKIRLEEGSGFRSLVDNWGTKKCLNASV